MKKIIFALLLLAGAAQIDAQTVHFTAVRNSATKFGIYMIPDATFTTLSTSVVGSYTITIRVPTAIYSTAPVYTVLGNTSYVFAQPDNIITTANTTGTAYWNTQFAWTTAHNVFSVTFNANTPYRMGEITIPAGMSMDDIEVVDWARNRLDNSTANGLNWANYISIDGTDITNNTAIFSSSVSTPTGGLNNSGTTNATSTLRLSSAVGPLPVKLVSFTAIKASDIRSQINWQTSMEQGSDYFDIERAVDGKNFNVLVRHLTAAGSSTTPLDYQTYDNEPANGTNYYRLKMMDKSGKFTYSEVRTVNFGITRSYAMSPNPASDVINVKGMDIGATVMVMTTAGQVVSETKAEATTQAVKVNSLVPGMYYVQIIQDGTIVFNQKFVKQ